MRYAQIRELDISNGEGLGVALFVQGCEQHCTDCFNPETWDKEGGKEWTESVQNYFLQLVDRSYIKRVSFLGGEPLLYENLPKIYNLVMTIRRDLPDKKIWLYTGKTLKIGVDKDGTILGDFADVDIGWDNSLLANHIIRNCDVVVDGAFIAEKKDLSLPFRGSSNQRIIDVKETLKRKEIVCKDVS